MRQLRLIIGHCADRDRIDLEPYSLLELRMQNTHISWRAIALDRFAATRMSIYREGLPVAVQSIKSPLLRLNAGDDYWMVDVIGVCIRVGCILRIWLMIMTLAASSGYRAVWIAPVTSELNTCSLRPSVCIGLAVLRSV